MHHVRRRYDARRLAHKGHAQKDEDLLAIRKAVDESLRHRDDGVFLELFDRELENITGKHSLRTLLAVVNNQTVAERAILVWLHVVTFDNLKRRREQARRVLIGAQRRDDTSRQLVSGV